MKFFNEKSGFHEEMSRKILRNDFSILENIKLNKKIVMCHGTFDLVHPGHLRHLVYAKSKGDILIVSITSDAFVFKANARPYVPEELRALNLAALAIVDFVIVDDEERPLQLIEKLKPNIFVKGFEYNKNGELNPKSLEEKKVVEKYGGKYIFSPGDFVLSSSQIIENNPPRLALEKLLILMEIEGITFKDIYETLKSMKNKYVCIVGDSIVDGLIESTIIGGHRKTPTPSVRILSENKFVGGAAIVALHLAATGAKVEFVSICGDDENGKFLKKSLTKENLNLNLIIDPERPTTFKNAISADGYKLLRMDTVENKIIENEQLDKILKIISKIECDAVVLSDFRHGLFNKSNIQTYLKCLPKNVLKIADSQVASRWGNILDFSGVDIVTPNESEVRFALGDQDTVIRPLGTELYEKANCKVLFLKLGEKGLMTFRDPALDSAKRSFYSLDSIHLKEVIDAVGAGDAFLAYSTLAYIVSKNDVIASIIGNIAAGLACEQEGNHPISMEYLTKRINDIQRICDFSEQ